MIEKMIEEIFSHKVKVDFIDNYVNSELKDEYLKNKVDEENKLINETMLAPSNKKGDNKSKEKNLIPYFFLYLFDNQKYKNEKELLMRECGEQKTAKNIYIMGILSTNYKS